MNKQELVTGCEYSIQQMSDLSLSDFHWGEVTPMADGEKHQGGVLDPWWELHSDDGVAIHLGGYVYNEDKWRYGEVVKIYYVTSLNYDEKSQTGVVYTRNTKYTLGKKLEGVQ